MVLATSGVVNNLALNITSDTSFPHESSPPAMYAPVIEHRHCCLNCRAIACEIAPIFCTVSSNCSENQKPLNVTYLLLLQCCNSHHKEG